MKIHRRIAIALLSTALLLPACKGDSDAKDWSATPLSSQTANVGGVEVSWQVPEGLSKDAALSNDSRVTLKSADMGAPSVSLKKGLGPTTDLAAAANSAGFVFGSGGETIEQAERDGRFVVTLANAKRTKVLVAHYFATDAAALECVVSQSVSEPLAKFDETVARFHEICDSVKVQ